MHNRIWFIAFGSSVCSNDICDLLMQAAYIMFRTRRSTYKLRSTECAGRVETKFERALIGTTSGVIFRATLENDGGINEVVYLVRDKDLEILENADAIIYGSPCLMDGDDFAVELRPNPIRALRGQN